MALVVVFVIIRVLRLLRLLLARIDFTVHRHRVPFRLPIVLIDIVFLVLKFKSFVCRDFSFFFSRTKKFEKEKKNVDGPSPQKVYHAIEWFILNSQPIPNES